jgi:hypothetical protein
MSKTTVRYGNPARQFVELPKVSIPRSVLKRDFDHKTAFKTGKLIPIFIDEVLPGDTFNVTASLLARLSTPIVPFMDNLYLRTFFFFVPNRLVWNHWEALNGDQRSGPTASTDYLVPEATLNNLQIGTIGDYLGLPVNVNADCKMTELPLRCISLIWNEWFRDQNLQDAYNIDKTTDREFVGDAAISGTNVDNPLTYGSEPPPVAKFHDYFTSALPWPQKGPGVEISLGGSVPAVVNDIDIVSSGNLTFNRNRVTVVADNLSVSSLGDQAVHIGQTGDSYALSYASGLSASGSGTVDLSEATPISINDLRQAFQLQKLMERDARGGTRYIEILRSHFGVVSPDARLQRPEYLGGGRSHININPVQQTSGTADSATTPQGNLAAYGVGMDVRHAFTKSFVEHGWIIGFCCVQSDLTYQQGLPRMWSRKGRWDFYWPALAHLGEQAILNKEIYFQGTADDDKVFGYQERYAEYRYHQSMITGQLRSTSSTPLDVWHLAEKFDQLPVLNGEFIRDNTPIERVVAVTDEPPIICDCFFKMKCVRPMPIYATPGLVDHF